MASGTSLTSTAQNYSNQAESGVYTHAQEAKRDGQKQNLVSSFPRKGLSTRDPRDDIMRQKMEALAAGPGQGMTPFGQIQATDADFKWLQRKREADQMANLDAWIGENFHIQDPAQLKWLRETWPEYFEAREQVMMERAQFALRVKLLELMGPRDEQDMILLWGLQTGRIQLDRDWDVIGPARAPGQSIDMDAERSRYKKGLLQRPRYVSDTERASNAAGFDMAGQPVRGGNPFSAGGNVGPSGFQSSTQSFPGFAVPSKGRYGNFLTEAIAPYVN